MVELHKSRMLQLLLAHKKEEFPIRAIARKTGLDYKTAYLTVKELTEGNLITSRKVGQTVLCSLNQKEFNADLFLAELQRKKELLNNKKFSALCGYFDDIQNPFFILLLFGSYAAGNPRKKSDIDLLLIIDDEAIKKLVEQRISLIPLAIHLTAFTSEEFLSQLKTTQFNVGQEAFYNNLILFGIEDYYRLIHHA